MDEFVIIKCSDSCVYNLLWPAFFLEHSKSVIKKLLKNLFDFDWENEKSIEFLDRAFPALLEIIEKRDIPDAQERWAQESKKFSNEYLNTDPAFFPPGTAAERRKERERRKKHNDRLAAAVKAAKTNYERQKKRLARAEEIHVLYLNEKR